jgi:hypothetical protein
MTGDAVAQRALIPSTQEVNPVSIETIIRDVSNEIARGVNIVSTRLAKFRAAEGAYEVAYSTRFMAHDGPQTEKRHAAVLATVELRKRKDEAEVLYKHAATAMSALEKELTAWQTINKTVMAMYGAAGTGQGG